MKRLSFAFGFLFAAIIAVGFVVYNQVSGQHHRSSITTRGALNNATVSFGAWTANPPVSCPGATPADPRVQCPPIDRLINADYPLLRFSNHHAFVPEVAKIKAGGTVNFIIAGFHVLSIYGDGTQPSDINVLSLVPGRPPMTPPIIDSPNGRIYRGRDPVTAGFDRVEVVQFDEPGTYLVICAVLPHFAEGMYGYVRVLPNDTAGE